MSEKLKEFPANIKRFHGRDHALIVLFRWNDDQRENSVKWLNALSATAFSKVSQKEEKLTHFPTSAQVQEDQRDTYRLESTDGRTKDKVRQFPVFTFGLSKSGLSKLGLDHSQTELIEGLDQMIYKMSYQNGMVDGFDRNLTSADGFIMIAHADSDEAKTLADEMANRAEGNLFMSWVVKEMHRIKEGDVDLDPLGFRDGISQPDPTKVVTNAEITDPFLKENGLYGSMMSLIKLRTNKLNFDELVEATGRNCYGNRDMNAAERETISSLIMGRNKAGVPRARRMDSDDLATSHDDDFIFDREEDALLCPYASHIRAVNARSSETDRFPKIVRRGMPYRETNDSGQEEEGLYFISYQNKRRNLIELFERMRTNEDFLLYRPSAVRKFLYRNPNPVEVKIEGVIKEVIVPSWDKLVIDLLGENYFYVPPVSFCARINYNLHDNKVEFTRSIH